jgi:ABC-2 type transport system permease protein
MLTAFRYAFGRHYGQILGWGVGLGFYGATLMYLYDTMMTDREMLEQLVQSYPPELFAFFGGALDFFSAAGYLHTYFFSFMPIVIGIFAVLVGTGLLVADEESGVLDLVLAHPISRAGLFWGRLAAFLLAAFLIMVISYLGFALLLPGVEIGTDAVSLTLPFLSLFAFVAFFGTLSLLLSLLLPSRRLAASVSGMILVASYLITSIGNLDETVARLADFSPVTYLEGGRAVEGLNLVWFGGLLGFALAFALLAWLLFERRDIRVGGEGSWILPKRRARREKAYQREPA